MLVDLDSKNRQNLIVNLRIDLKKRKWNIFDKIDQNKIRHLSESIGNCRELSELVLTENCLSVLPESVGNLSHLTVLHVGRNRLEELTPKIGKCSKLRMLFLRENQLTELPSSIGNLENIQTLDVSGNRLDWLPDTLLKLDIKDCVINRKRSLKKSISSTSKCRSNSILANFAPNF